MRSLQRLPLRLKIASVGGLVLLLMLITVALSSISTNRYLAVEAERARSESVTEQSNSLLLSLVDMETGVRGYVITAEEEFLEPYNSGAASYPVALQRLEADLQGTPSQLDRLARVRNLVDYWHHKVLTAEINLVGGAGDARQIVASKTGKVTMDQIRAELREINLTESEKLHRLEEQTVAARSQARTGTWGLTAAAVLLGLVVATLLARSITRPIDELLKAAAEVAQGNAGLQVPVVFDDEIGGLAAGFNRMSLELQAHQEEHAAQNEELQAQQEELEAQNEELVAQQETVTQAVSQLEHERDRLASLNRFSRMALEATDLGALARLVLDQLLEAAGAQVGALALLSTGDQMRIAAATGLTEAAVRATHAAGFPLEAARVGRPLQVAYPRTALLRPVYHTEVPVEAELYLPIAYGDESLAVVILGRTDARAFQSSEIQWMEVLTAQAAAALSNCLAYEKLNRTYTELQESAAQIEELTSQFEEERDRATGQRDNLQAILESTSEGICMVSPRGRVMLINDRFWSLLGLQPREALMLNDLFGSLSPRMRDSELTARFLEHALQDGAMVGTHTIELVEPASRILQCYTAPIHAEDGTLLGRLFVQRDVTRETEVDRMKTEFISTVSHELRTPLTSIRGYVDLILDGDVGEISAEQREFLELVSGSTVRLANLINDLLDVEKIENGHMGMRHESVNVAPILEQVVRTFQVTADEHGLGLNLAIAGNLPPVVGDPDRLTQVFTNLVSNALKYTKAGEVRLTATAHEDELIIAVADTGIGIAKEHLPNLFGKFYRVDNQYTREVGGTGLGLAITKAIVERHNGRVEAESVLGQGSTFTVYLPSLGRPR